MLPAGSFHLSWEGNSLYLKALGRHWAPSPAPPPSLVVDAGLGSPQWFSACSCPALPRTPQSPEHHGGPGKEQPEPVWTTRDGEGWGCCGSAVLPRSQRLRWAGAGCAEAPREGKSLPSPLPTQRGFKKKQEVKQARGRNSGQPRNGTGLQTA